jgi:hypothetical protein
VKPIQQPIRATALKAGRISMAHMRLEMMRRAGEAEGKDSPALRWGRLVHLAILQPCKLAEIPVWTGSSRRVKEWTEFAASLGADGEYVTRAEIAELSAISIAAAFALDKLSPVVETEHEIFWTDPAYGGAIAQPDAILIGGATLEIKTTSKIEERAFRSQAWQLGYPIQVAWYDHAARVCGYDGDRIILAIESRRPYSTALWRIGPQAIKDSYHEAAGIAIRYRECEAVGRYPGPYDSEGIMALEPPTWAVNDTLDINAEGASNDL